MVLPTERRLIVKRPHGCVVWPWGFAGALGGQAACPGLELKARPGF
jgi:hypothetical protein